MQINAGHYSGCCYEWPWREVYYILNLADIFYHALLLITIHSRWADVHIYTHRHTHRGCVKVIMMAVWRASEAFRWVILIGKHRQDTLSFPLQIKGVSAPLLLCSFSPRPPTTCLPVCRWRFVLCSFDLTALVICSDLLVILFYHSGIVVKHLPVLSASFSSFPCAFIYFASSCFIAWRGGITGYK